MARTNVQSRDSPGRLDGTGSPSPTPTAADCNGNNSSARAGCVQSQRQTGAVRIFVGLACSRPSRHQSSFPSWDGLLPMVLRRGQESRLDKRANGPIAAIHQLSSLMNWTSSSVARYRNCSLVRTTRASRHSLGLWSCRHGPPVAFTCRWWTSTLGSSQMLRPDPCPWSPIYPAPGPSSRSTSCGPALVRSRSRSQPSTPESRTSRPSRPHAAGV
jgi:hypothetical protein